MSPKSRGRRPNRRPSDVRRARRRADRLRGRSGPSESVVARITGEADRLAAVASPLDAEVFTSELLGALWQHPETSDEPTQARIEEQLVGELAQTATPGAIALLYAMAAVGWLSLSERAGSTLAGLPESVLAARPPWSGQIGKVRADRCITVDDEFGDATQVLLTYAYDGQPPHLLCVLVDHNLGIAKDAWAAPDATAVLDHLDKLSADDERMRVADADPAHTRAVLERALSTTDQVPDPPVNDTFRGFRALAFARMRALPAGAELPEPPEWSEDELEALAEEFASSPDAEGLDREAAVAVATEVVGYGAVQDRGQPLRVSPSKFEALLIGWLPHTGLLDPEYVGNVPDVLPAFARWAGARTGLSAGSVEETVSAVPGLVEEFADAYQDPQRWGAARIAVDRLLSDIDLSAEDADEVFERRMLAVGRMPDEDFDAGDEGDLAAPVFEDHPEYADVLTTTQSDSVGPRGAVEGAVERAHLALHTTVARQLWFGDPPEAWAAARRLLDAGHDRHDTLHALMFALAEAGPDDPSAYQDALAALPGSWEQEFGED